MPIYPYECSCGENFETWLKISELDAIEIHSPTCDNILSKSNRKIGLGQTFINEAVEDAEYCEALGQVVKNRNHRRQIAKQKGLIEIGTEPAENIHKHFSEARKQKDDTNTAEMTHEVMSALQ